MLSNVFLKISLLSFFLCRGVFIPTTLVINMKCCGVSPIRKVYIRLHECAYHFYATLLC